MGDIRDSSVMNGRGGSELAEPAASEVCCPPAVPWFRDLMSTPGPEVVGILGSQDFQARKTTNIEREREK
jgi:hypothetical protein